MKKYVLSGALAMVFVGVSEWSCAQDLAAPLEWAGTGKSVTDDGEARIAPAGMPARGPEILIPVQNPLTLATADEMGSVPGGVAGKESAEGLAGWVRRVWPGQMTVAMAMVAAGVAEGGVAVEAVEGKAGSLDRKSDCFSLALRVGQRVKEDRASLFEVVTSEVAANGKCACEVVKAALVAAEADPAMVAQLVEAVAVAAPDTMRMVAQCAIAVSPESLSGVQAVLAKLDPNGAGGTGGGDSKDAKASLAKAALTPAPDILDLPPPMQPPLIVIPVTDPIGWRWQGCVPAK